ncbi:MAG: hypothetical protein NTW50_03140 [Candidatus Berkelbacteria bacterium]|nr:hypothetical protein [Candidatus Berkelbacteria bacterium]
MGRGYIVTNSSSADLGVKKKTVERGFSVGPTAIRFVTIIIIAVLAVVYLSQSTAGASRSVKLNDLQSKQDSLSLEKERLEAEQTRLKSLQSVDQGVANQGMEQVGNVEHLGGATTSN